MQELRDSAIDILNRRLALFNDKSNFDEVFTPTIYYHMCFSHVYAYYELGVINSFEAQNFIDRLNREIATNDL